MARCPNCANALAADAKTCGNCGALFTGEGWTPIVDGEKPAPPPASTPSRGLLIKFGFAAVLLPGIAFLIALLISNVVPGCRCDSGAGCGGCGADGLVAFLLFGGFTGALFSLLVVLPACFILSAIASLFSSDK